jgi:hypothetical protein
MVEMHVQLVRLLEEQLNGAPQEPLRLRLRWQQGVESSAAAALDVEPRVRAYTLIDPVASQLHQRTEGEIEATTQLIRAAVSAAQEWEQGASALALRGKSTRPLKPRRRLLQQAVDRFLEAREQHILLGDAQDKLQILRRSTEELQGEITLLSPRILSLEIEAGVASEEGRQLLATAKGTSGLLPAQDLLLRSQEKLSKGLEGYERLGGESEGNARDIEGDLRTLADLLTSNEQALQALQSDLDARFEAAKKEIACGRSQCVEAEEAIQLVKTALVELAAVKAEYERKVIGAGAVETPQVRVLLKEAQQGITEAEKETAEGKKVQVNLEEPGKIEERCRQHVEQATTAAAPYLSDAQQQVDAAAVADTLREKQAAYQRGQEGYEQALILYSNPDVKLCDLSYGQRVEEALQNLKEALRGVMIDVPEPTRRAEDLVAKADRRRAKLPGYFVYSPFNASEVRAIDALYTQAISIYQGELGDDVTARRTGVKRAAVQELGQRKSWFTLGYLGGLIVAVAGTSSWIGWRLLRLRALGRDREDEKRIF